MVWLSKFNDQAQDGNPIFNPYSMKPVQTYTRSIGRNFIKRQARAMVDRFRGTENPISYSQAKAVLNKELERIKKEQEERDDS